MWPLKSLETLLSEIEFSPFRIGGCPLFKRNLFLSDKFYLMSKGQTEGEREIISLAETAEREDHWTHFKDTNYWLHFELKHSIVIDAKKGMISMGYSTDRINKCTAKEAGLGEEIAEYHIHPDSFIDFYIKVNQDYADLSRELYKTLLLPYPSLTDLNSTIRLPDREYKIASSLGITTYILHDKKFKNDHEWLDLIRECYLNSKISQEDINLFKNPQSTSKDEVVACAVMRQLNKAAGGTATLSFIPRSNL